jgi:P4 family phage/plasmid primase-like protien
MSTSEPAPYPRPAPERVDPGAFVVSLFGGLSDTTPKPDEWDRHDMVKQLTRFKVLPSKSAASLWSAANFKPCGSRCKDDVESISMLVFDVDHAGALAPLIQKLEELGYFAIVYTTYSHTTESLCCRIVVPLLESVPASVWESFFPIASKLLGDQLGVEFDPACKDACRFFFVPSHAEGAAHHAEAFHEWDGPFLDPRPMIAAGREEAQRLEAERKARRDAMDAEAKRTGQPSALRHYVDRAIDDELGELASAQPGEQSNALNSASFSLASLLAGGDLLAEWPDIEGRMVHIAVNVWTFSREPWTEAEALRTIRSGYKAGVMKPREHVGTWQADESAGGWARPQPAPEPEPDLGPEPDAAEAGKKKQPEAGPQLVTRHAFTDTGNAKLFVQLNRNVRYVPGFGWYINDGVRWVHDNDNRILEMTERVSEHIHADADRSSCDELADKKWRKDAHQWAKNSESHSRRVAMVQLAQVERSVVLAVAALDRNKYLFNVLNGTIDLRTGELRPHNPDDYITKLAPVTYRPDAKTPRLWLETLNRIFDRIQDLIAFFQRFAGYSLTGDTEEQAFGILHGSGANGKSTLVSVLSTICGDYVEHTSMDTFTTSKEGSSGASNALARLFGARMVFATELNKGARLAESTVKQCTGGDVVVARFLYKEFFKFHPQFKLWMVTNHMPKVGTDEAIFRRIRRIPFGVIIPPVERDPKLKARLLEEADEIFNWLVEGAISCLRDGLGTCAAVTDSTNQYREDMDPIADFLEECAQIRPGARVAVPVFYAAYAKYAENQRDRAISKKAFTGLLNLRSIESKGGTVRVYVGVELKEDDR